VYALKESNGTEAWKFRMGEKINYPWRFDYYYSSPILVDDKLIIGGDDGYLYVLNRNNGKLVWKFKSKGLVRGTAAAYNNTVYFGDTEGRFYALDINSGKEKWVFKIIGEPMNLEELGFDRKAMLGAPVISRDRIIFGARDGFLYCLNLADGKQVWKMDHEVSWIISTVAVKDSFVVTGTSDGRFIQAVHFDTGKQLWMYHTPKSTWCSPLINNDKVYEGCADGQLYCLDLATGKRISQFATNGIVYSSPVVSDSLLFVGSDDGHLYALKGHPPVKQSITERYVYFDTAKLNVYFRTGGDIRVKDYLKNNGFKVIGTDSLVNIFSSPSGSGKSIVFATDFFTKRITQDGNNSLLRKFLDSGGRVVLVGSNPLFFETDPTEKQMTGQAKRRTDTVLNLDFGPPDTRTFGGIFSSAANEKGNYFGLPPYWVSNFGIDKKKVDVSLGENENGQASSFIKKYNNGGALVQIWIHPEVPERLDAIIKVAEWDLGVSRQ
jgi:outer membrane protein assembly factor BamB